MKKKSYLLISTIILLFLVCNISIQADAFCFGWEELVSKSYCATPVCYTGNRTAFTEHRYERICTDGVFEFHKEHRIEKVNNGCCSYN